MVRLIATTATNTKVNVFRRFALMRHWRERDGMSFDAFTSPDGLHMNDWGYGCWAKLLSAAISGAATRVVTSAHAVPASVHTNNKSSDPVASFFVVLSPLCPLPRGFLPSNRHSSAVCSAVSN